MAVQAFDRSVENSVYVDHHFLNQGIGKALLADLIRRAKQLDHHTIIAAIDGEQGPSIALHGKYGFQKAGELYEAGYKFGRWLNMIYMQRMISEP